MQVNSHQTEQLMNMQKKSGTYKIKGLEKSEPFKII
jgi:hypothetical protein